MDITIVKNYLLTLSDLVDDVQYYTKLAKNKCDLVKITLSQQNTKDAEEASKEVDFYINKIQSLLKRIQEEKL